MNRTRLGALALTPLLAAAGLGAASGPSLGATLGTALDASLHVSAAPAGRTVTIRAENTDLSGSVRSSRASCRSEVRVVVFKQKGSRGGGDDARFATDTSEPDGAWDTGNTGTEGRFYARVARSPGCQGDTSPTIRARRAD